MPKPAGKSRRWGCRFLLATELIVVVLLVAGGCYSKQNYNVLSPQAGDEGLNKCDVVVGGRVVYVEHRDVKVWQQHVFFCWPFEVLGPELSRPVRYDISVEIDTVLKGDPTMPRRLQLNNCRPLTPEERALIPQADKPFPDKFGLRIGYNRQHGNSYSNLIIVPLGDTPTTKPSTRLIPSVSGAG